MHRIPAVGAASARFALVRASAEWAAPCGVDTNSKPTLLARALQGGDLNES